MPGLSIRGGCTPGNSRLGQLAPLVLIKRLAHVRGPVPGVSIRALGSELPLVLIERIAHVRGGSGLPSPPPAGAPPPKGEARLGSPLGGAGAVRRLRGQNLALLPSFREATFSVRRRPGKTLRCFPSFFSGWRPLRARARSQPFLKKRRPKKLYARYRSAAPLTGCSLR